HGSRCEGFHFYAGLADCLGAGLDGDSVLIGVQDELDAQVGKRQGKAQGNQQRSLLGALDAGDACDAQHTALGAGAGRVAQGCEGLRSYLDTALRHGLAARRGLASDIDNPGLFLGVEMGERIFAWRGHDDLKQTEWPQCSKSTCLARRALSDSSRYILPYIA